MDTITQGLFGAGVAQVGFRDRIGRDAGWVAALCAASPDLDVHTSRILGWLGRDFPLSNLVYHRGATHSLFAIPLIAAAFALPWWAIRRRMARRRRGPDATHDSGAPPPLWLMYACCFLAVATHALLDAFTSYGTQLLWPVSRKRFAWDSIPIIDLFVTGTFILGLTACYVIRRRNIARRGRMASSVAAAMLLAVMGYIGAGRAMHNRAIDRALAALPNETQRSAVRADAYPAIGHIFLWRVVVETPDAWIATRVHHFSGDLPTPAERTRVKKQPENRWIRAARKTPEHRIYDWFALRRLRPVYREDPAASRHVVMFHDMRYAVDSAGVESLWPLVVEIDGRGEILAVRRGSPRRDRGFGKFVAAIWSDMWTP
jgi:inner membrane protein